VLSSCLVARPTRLCVEKRGLMSYGPNLPYTFKLVARYVDRILKGAKPGDLPVGDSQRLRSLKVVRTSAAAPMG
jgi:putative ABC transport system substrate-binding protein